MLLEMDRPLDRVDMSWRGRQSTELVIYDGLPCTV